MGCCWLYVSLCGWALRDSGCGFVAVALAWSLRQGCGGALQQGQRACHAGMQAQHARPAALGSLLATLPAALTPVACPLPAPLLQLPVHEWRRHRVLRHRKGLLLPARQLGG